MGAGGDLGVGLRVGLRAFGVDFTIAAIAMTQECAVSLSVPLLPA